MSSLLSPFRKLVSVLPPSVPIALYNFASRIPGLHQLTTKLIRSTIPDEYSLPEGVITMNREDIGVCGMLAWGNFEKFETEIFRAALHPNMTVVDIGANIGFYTLIAASRVGPDGKVYAFEPDAKNASFLRTTIERNKLSNVTLSSTALSNEKGERPLFSGGDNRGLFSFADNRNTDQSVVVATDTLDSYLAALGWPKIDIIKMDIEGAEPLALEGMRETLKRNPEVIMFCECYPKGIARLGSSAEKYLEIFIDAGFKIWWMDEDSQNVTPITDIAQFVSAIPQNSESYRNILVSH